MTPFGGIEPGSGGIQNSRHVGFPAQASKKGGLQEQSAYGTGPSRTFRTRSEMPWSQHGSTAYFLVADFWSARAMSPWRDNPCAIGNWNSWFRQFRRKATADVFECFSSLYAATPILRLHATYGATIRFPLKATSAKRGPRLRPFDACAADQPPRSWHW